MQRLGERLGRIVIPLATPFSEGNQDVDYDAAAALVDHVIRNRCCDSLVVAGTSGEFNTLTVEERFELFRVVKGAAGGRVPLRSSTMSTLPSRGSTSTRPSCSTPAPWPWNRSPSPKYPAPAGWCAPR